MILLGVTETIQLIDGSSDLPTMRALKETTQVVAIGAPAIAGALDAILAMDNEAEKKKLRNRLDGILRGAEEDNGSGLEAAPPVYRLIPFSGDCINAFGSIREATPADQLDIFDAQNISIVRTEDATLLLVKTDENLQTVNLLVAAGIELRIQWID
jgi:hypothetical protein